MVPRRLIAHLLLLLASEVVLFTSAIVTDDSVEACSGKAVNASCSFRLPVVDDRFSFPMESLGELQDGKCSTRGVTRFCHATPHSNAIAACAGKTMRTHCTWAAPGKDTWLRLEAFTSQRKWAGTKGAVYVSFEIDSVWTPPHFFFKGIWRGRSKAKAFKIHGWPSKVSFTVNSNDAWGFWKISVNGTAIIEDKAGIRGSVGYCSYHPPYYYGTCKSYRSTKFWIEGPPASQIFTISDYGTGAASRTGQQQVSLGAFTSSADMAATTGCVHVSFKVNKVWSQPMEFFCGAKLGQVKRKSFTLAAFPTKLLVALNSTDTWGFWKVTIDDLVVIEDRAGQYGSHDFDAMAHEYSDTSYWLESPPRTVSFANIAPAPTTGQGSTFNRAGKCSEAWSGEMFCDDDAYIDRRPAENIASSMKKRREGKEYVVVALVVRNVNYAKLAADATLLKTFETTCKEALAAEVTGLSTGNIVIELKEGSVVVIATITLPQALQDSGITAAAVTKRMRMAGMDMTTKLKALSGIGAITTGTLEAIVVDMGQAHQADLEKVEKALDKAEKATGDTYTYQYNGKVCSPPSLSDIKPLEGRRCSLDRDDGTHKKVCAYSSDPNRNTMCTLEECYQFCKAAGWCTAYSFANYQGAKDITKTIDQCYIFDKCHVMDDHDAYYTWYPSCLAQSGPVQIETDAPVGQREYLKLDGLSKTGRYKDIDDYDGDDDDDGGIEVEGTKGAVIIGAIIGGVVILCCCVAALAVYVLRLKRQLKEANSNPGNIAVAVGRPIATTGNAPDGAVVGGIPVVEQQESPDEKDPKNQAWS